MEYRTSNADRLGAPIIPVRPVLFSGPPVNNGGMTVWK